MKFKIKISNLGKKSSIQPNQMTEKYLVEVDIENPYFYGCGKPLKKTNLHF